MKKETIEALKTYCAEKIGQVSASISYYAKQEMTSTNLKRINEGVQIIKNMIATIEDLKSEKID